LWGDGELWSSSGHRPEGLDIRVFVHQSAGRCPVISLAGFICSCCQRGQVPLPGTTKAKTKGGRFCCRQCGASRCAEIHLGAWVWTGSTTAGASCFQESGRAIARRIESVGRLLVKIGHFRPCVRLRDRRKTNGVSPMCCRNWRVNALWSQKPCSDAISPTDLLVSSRASQAA